MKLTVETDRLLLRPFAPEDAEDMFNGWTSDPEVAKYVTWPAHKDVSVTRALLAQWEKEYEKPERLNFAIVIKETNELIGGIDVVGYIEGTPVIGYNLNRKFWNRGYMTEACRRVIELLFEKGHDTVKIDAMVENAASNRVIVKCGGVLVCTNDDERPLKGDMVRVNRYLVSKDSFARAAL